MIEEFDISKFNLHQYDKKPVLLHGGSVQNKKKHSKKLKTIYEDAENLNESDFTNDSIQDQEDKTSKVVKLSDDNVVSEFGYYDDVVKYPPTRTPKNCQQYELAGLIPTLAVHLCRLKDISEYVFTKSEIALNALTNPSSIVLDLLESKILDVNIIRDVETVSYSLLEKYQPDIDLLHFNFKNDKEEKEKVITELWGLGKD